MRGCRLRTRFNPRTCQVTGEWRNEVVCNIFGVLWFRRWSGFGRRTVVGRDLQAPRRGARWGVGDETGRLLYGDVVQPILINQHVQCDVQNRKEFDAAQAVINSMLPMPASTIAATAKTKREPPRRPILCDTTPKAYGGSTTDCF
jgi:hypothetical protein